MATSQTLSSSERGVLDSVLRPHLRLDPTPEQLREQRNSATTAEDGRVVDDLSQSLGAGQREMSEESKPILLTKRFRSKSETSRPFSRSTVRQSTAEADNKRRPGISRRISSRFRQPSPEPPDPNSEAKSQTIRRMQSNLETWDKQLEEIMHKKEHNDKLTKSEIEKRDQQLEEMTEKYNREFEKRQLTELERDNLSSELENTSEELSECKAEMNQLQANLEQYQQAYSELDENKKELEEHLEEITEQLQKSEGMRRRLNDQVTDLQGQLAIEEQRSRFCTIL